MPTSKNFMNIAARLACALALFLGCVPETRGAITGTVRTIGGSWFAGYVDGDNTVSLFNQPSGLAVTPDGLLLVADFGNNAVRTVNPNAEIVGTFVNQGLSGPIAVAVDASGNVLVLNATSG